MTTHIEIKVLSGGYQVSSADEHRAKEAAENYFISNGIDPLEAYEAVTGEGEFTCLVSAFIAAEAAASEALTSTWDKPGLCSAFCAIEVWSNK
jgi:hypothetical protein